MTNKRNKDTGISILLDSVAAAGAWAVFYTYRKYVIESDKFGYPIPLNLDKNFYLALIYVPIFWVALYYLSGYYNDVWRKSRIKEISSTFSLTLLGVILLFFLLLIDDEVSSYEAYYKTTLTLFILHFTLTSFVRIAFAVYIKRRIKSKTIGFNSIVIGNNQRTLDLVKELKSDKTAQGFLLIGYVNGHDENHLLKQELPMIGTYNQLSELIKKHDIDEVIIGIESSKHQEINTVTSLLEEEKVHLKIIPDLYDMMSGSVKMNNVIGTVLIEINHDVMPTWQKVLKRLLDIFVSLFVLIFFLPLFIVLSIVVKTSSKGPIFFKQIRIGYKGKGFKIIKFRTMFTDAEINGPALSSSQDKRITPTGKWMRKYRLDELPQFYNVLIGEMSLVGPRPEREFFINQILILAPHYKHLHRVKPGITSWGQVKYGYAESVEQMVERLKFDILYIENRSLAVDIRILIYTIKTIIDGAGK